MNPLMLSAAFEPKKQSLKLKMRRNLLSTNKDTFVAEFNAIWQQHRDLDWNQLILDMNLTKMVDSIGLNVLQGMISLLRENGRQLTILVSSPSIRKVFAFTRIDQKATVIMREKRPRKE